MPEPTNRRNHSLAARVVRSVLAAMALGELGVGLAVIAFPGAVAGFLVAAPMEGVGLVVARMLGISVSALGLTWWLARGNLDQRLNGVAPGFVAYNLGVGLLFLLYALSMVRSEPMPWVVGVVHLLAGLTFVAAALARPKSGETN